MARGAPKNPAATSGPGKLARRTDGGPGSSTQPLRVPSGGDYGDRQAAETQQRSAPLAAQAGPPTGGGGAPIPLPSPSGVFGPTERPNVPLTQGLGQQAPGASPVLDPTTLLRVLYEKFPSPYLARLMENDRPPGV
jgi:hypothetical protein